MKSLLISVLLVAVLVLLSYKTLFKGSVTAPGTADDDAPPSDRYMRGCEAISSAKARPAAYCLCLWSKGVKNLTRLASSASAQAKAAECERATNVGKP